MAHHGSQNAVPPTEAGQLNLTPLRREKSWVIPKDLLGRPLFSPIAAIRASPSVRGIRIRCRERSVANERARRPNCLRVGIAHIAMVRGLRCFQNFCEDSRSQLGSRFDL